MGEENTYVAHLEEQAIVKAAEELAKQYNGRMRRENWDNEKDEPMLKIVLTFKL